MTVDLTKSTFTADEAAELQRMGYTMAEFTLCGNYTGRWIIAANTQHSKENKEPSWQK